MVLIALDCCQQLCFCPYFIWLARQSLHSYLCSLIMFSCTKDTSFIYTILCLPFISPLARSSYSLYKRYVFCIHNVVLTIHISTRTSCSRVYIQCCVEAFATPNCFASDALPDNPNNGQAMVMVPFPYIILSRSELHNGF